MLIPNKHSHPDRTPIAVAVTLLPQVRRKRSVPFNELRDFLKGRMPEGDFLFGSAMDVLYLLGLVEYRSKSDLFEYVGP
ncbi:ABC-three component system middle component 8 [Arthrobacter sp. U41]|uniref:ABC-three component system middle component 8 n=1 Tax=Arthrobacter sp. U41 TaxID=1849032 RepID=UPI0009F47984